MEKYYLIVPVSEANKINFEDFDTTSLEHARKSVDGSKFILKWTGEEPEAVSELDGTEGPYSHDELGEFINSKEWLIVVYSED